MFKKIAGLFSSRKEEVPAQRPGRNEPCWCGSGKKYKKCHLEEDEKKLAPRCNPNCGS